MTESQKKNCNDSRPQLLELSGGLRLAHQLRRGAGAGIFGIAVRAGSANEPVDKFGLAHLVEHTIFKGTTRRSSWHIINRMETVGGELNAYTTKEETVVYSVFPGGNLSRAVELIADLALNSRFPERELEKEREVVLDEINSYYDQPIEALYDDFEDRIFAETPYGHNILGTPESVLKLDSSDCRHFLDTFYRIPGVVLFYTGSRSPEAVAKLCNRYFVGLSDRPAREISDFRFATTPEKFEVFEPRQVHQAHVMLGTEVGGLFSEQRYAVYLLTNIIGGPGMNSLLNVELRERRGLVYTVESSTALYSGAGLLSIYFGCDQEDLDRCLSLVRDVLGRIADGEMSARRILAAKKQYLGQLAVASENAENRIMAAARSALFRTCLTPRELIEEGVMNVSAENLAALAARLSDASVLAFVH